MPDNDSTTLQTNIRTSGSPRFPDGKPAAARKKVLDLRFGLTGNGTHSLRQIGHLLRISKERVRQIQNRALEKLRAVRNGSAGSRVSYWTRSAAQVCFSFEPFSSH